MLKRLRRWRSLLPVYWHEAYRPPLTSIEVGGRFDPRRPDFVVSYLTEMRLLRKDALRRPQPASFVELARVHTPEYLESLLNPETLGRIFAVDPSDVPVDELLHSVRLACGGTLAAAREALRLQGPTLNLSGGFHHASPERGGGFCALNDVAIALATLRAEGLTGQVVVLDVDAHPPDGTAACLRKDAHSWLGSVSGVHGDAEALHTERVVPTHVGDDAYLEQLQGLLKEMPEKPVLAFVIAGGDVLQGDPLGHLGLSFGGIRKRDLHIADALAKVPSVWLPGGGYRADAWKVLAGTALVLQGNPQHRIPETFQPLEAHFAQLARELAPEALGEQILSPGDLAEVELELHMRRPAVPRLLGFYTRQGVEYALHRYGLLGFLERVGYRDFTFELHQAEAGDQLLVYGSADGRRHCLLECVLSIRRLDGRRFLFVNWLALKNPRAQFSPLRPKLPGQDVPGLGLSHEVEALFFRIAERLQLDGVMFRPAHFHLAAVAKRRFRFLDPTRQGRFEALLRDLASLPLLEATRAVADGRVTMNGKPYQWEADDMVDAVHPLPWDEQAVEAERARVTFQLSA